MADDKKIFLFEGFDESGEVFQYGHDIYRGIYRGYGRMAREILAIIEENNLFQKGIIETKIIKNDLFLNSNFEILLKHKKISFINYPHEWCTEMFKDAAIFHIDLFLELGKYGLVLKDWHPLNVVFDFNQPIFIDFSSIILQKLLEEQEYLRYVDLPFFLRNRLKPYEAQIYRMYQLMFVPYFLLPIYMIRKKNYNLIHKRIYETTLHVSRKTISENEVFGLNLVSRLCYKFQNLLDLYILNKNNNTFFKRLKKNIIKIAVSPLKSNYSDYYKRKKENFAFDKKTNWTKKQIIVEDIIKKYKPKTVLDVGCNTGWFSILAARYGCEVVAVDVDEACINQLYLTTRRYNYRILPLVFDILGYPKDTYSVPYENKKNKRIINRGIPLLLSADKRLKCEMVMMLALLHHLVLGQNYSFSNVFKIINKFSEKYLVLEFVSIEDELIQNEPEFFPAYSKNPEKFKFYKLENLISELRKYYRQINIINTNSLTRPFIICIK